MKIPKTIDDLKQLIADEVEENINLDYKAAGALQKSDGKKKEIAKDVSAMPTQPGELLFMGSRNLMKHQKNISPKVLALFKEPRFQKNGWSV